jgi:hypothetical protein
VHVSHDGVAKSRREARRRVAFQGYSIHKRVSRECDKQRQQERICANEARCEAKRNMRSTAALRTGNAVDAVAGESGIWR